MFRHRPEGPDLATLTSPASLEAAAAQVAAGADTLHDLGLDNGNAVVTGTLGLGLHGLYAHTGPSVFDADTVVDDPTFSGLLNPWDVQRPGKPPISGVDIPASDGHIPVTAIKTPLTGSLARSLHASSFADVSAQATEIDGLLVAPALAIVEGKADQGQNKDHAGILQAHLIAHETDHQIIGDEQWQRKVIGSRNALLYRAEHSRQLRRELPVWLGELCANRFNHPAFTSLHSSVNALRRAS